LRFRLTGGERHDITQAEALLDGLNFSSVIADRGYAAQDLLTFIFDHQAQAVIPPHQRAIVKRDYDTWVYRERHLVECFIGKLKHFRRIFSRFDKLARRYLAFLHFVGSLIWLR
jgi:transposase